MRARAGATAAFTGWIAASCLAGAFGARAEGETATELPRVDVIGVTPLPGLGVAKDRVPAPVQTATGADIERSGALTLGDFMNRRFASVHVNEIQGNPHQPDVSYRGYTASPLLGTPQGLSVYLDGIRLNQPFGDVVSWDLLPRSAIASIALMPGSNPLFGLNTLGGSLSVQTKDGFTHPGASMRLSGGSHGRAEAGFEGGGSDADGLSWFGTADLFRENGWRDDSPSRLGQLFAKLGWRSGATHASLTASAASTDLNGNGLQESRLLDARYASVYTKPDRTRNRAGLASLAFSHDADNGWTLSGHVYARRIDSRGATGDVQDGALDQPLLALSNADRSALAAAMIPAPAGVAPGSTPFPYLRCVAQALQGGDTDLACNGVTRSSVSAQTQGGLALQGGRRFAWGQTAHQLVVGAVLDASRTQFSQTAEAGFLTPDRSVTSVDAYLRDHGSSASLADSSSSAISLRSRTTTASFFGADTISLTNDVHVTVAGRYDRTKVANRDELRSSPAPDSLDGDHRFARFNPALGLNWNPGKEVRFHAGTSQGSRTPTAIELGCANPDQPCKLPNALAGDPPLKQVVTRTIEAGVDGQLADATTWRAGVFRSDSVDDLLFVSSDASGQGYFRNFGRTRRQGIELGAATTEGRFTFDVAWTLLDARFRSRDRLNGAGNSSNDAGPGLDGRIAIQPGDRLPLAPRQIFKAGLGVAVDARVLIDVDMIAIGSAIARGNENGRHAPDRVYYLGPGRSAGYAVFNLGGSVKATPALSFFARVGNVFDRRYATAAQLGSTGFDGAGRFSAQPFGADAEGRYPLRNSTFFAPGAPRLFSAGLRYRFE